MSHTFRNHLESIHSLPEYVRKIFMVVTMIFATTFVGLVSWLLFPPLQDIGLPSLGADQRVTNNYQAMDDLKQIVKDNEFASVIKIPEIGPASGFMQSFKAVSDLVVPQNLQNPATYVQTGALRPQSWFTSFFHVSVGAALKLRGHFLLALGDANKLKNRALAITASSLFSLSYLARVPSYASHLIDALITSTSRVAR